MSFAPYHQFRNAVRLQQLIEDFHSAGTITTQVYDGYSRYHPALIHKLKCAQHHLDRLEEKLTASDITEAQNSAMDFTFAVNMHMDSFFYAGGSALDILAREVIIYFGQPLPAMVYFKTAATTISASHPGDPLLPRLANPPWKDEFTNYRNVLTHELVVVTQYQIDISCDGGKTTKKIRVPLPDDPRAAPGNRKYKKKREILSYTTDHFRKMLKLINTIYGEIADRAESVGKLPL